MKYKDILEDVLAGKWFRQKPKAAWLKMCENGQLVNEYDQFGIVIPKVEYDLDTWEIKPDIPEDIYVWGVSIGTDAEGYDTYLLKDKTFTLCDPKIVPDVFKAKVGTSILLKEDGKALLSKSKPQKYKLIPVDEEQKKDHFSEVEDEKKLQNLINRDEWVVNNIEDVKVFLVEHRYSSIDEEERTINIEKLNRSIEKLRGR